MRPMFVRRRDASLTTGLVTIGVLLFASTAAPAADEKAAAKPKVTFADQVTPVFRNRCGTCHNPDKQKGGLNLETYSAAMQGGSSGKVIEPGDPDASTLLQLVMHKDEPKMPPSSPKIPDAEIEVIRQWIEGGALESSGSVAAVKAKPKFEFKLDPSSMGKPVGPPAMPENLPTEPVVVSAKAPAVVALAASPWAPLVAVGGHKQVLLYRTTDNHLVGVLPFPEGTVYSLKFSRNGALLLGGGGRGGQSGLAVAWDVKNGKRVFEIGKEKEYDVVLGADISPDHGQVALGGPGKIVRVYNTADGQLQSELKKHTDWITAVEFSPDGVLLATGDRSNGLFVWEAQTGREFHELRGHVTAITDVSWRLDANVLASASEDGTVKLWEMENGGQIKTWGAHGGGVASVRFAKDGRLVTTGRDRLTRLWDQNGGKQRDFEPFGDLALEAVFGLDDARVIAGDWSGSLRVFDTKDGRRLSTLAANPNTVAVRLDAAKLAIPAAEAASAAALAAVGPVKAAAVAQAAVTEKVAKAHAEAAAQAAAAKAAADGLDGKLAAKTAEEKVATDAMTAAQAVAAKAVADKAAADKTLPDTIAVERATADALAATKAFVVQALARKSEQDKALNAAAESLKNASTKAAADSGAAALAQEAMRATEVVSAIGLSGAKQAGAQAAWELAVVAKAAAPGVVATATAQAAATAAALKSAQDLVAKLSAEKGVAAKAVADARAGQKAVETAAAARKAELDQANAVRAATDKALAEKTQAADAAVAAVSAAKAEADLLAAEKQRGESVKSAMNAAKTP